MSVYIKGMEMPTSCRRCGFSQPDGCGFFCPVVVGKPIVDSQTHSRHARCPLVPVPEHGRLIDKDAVNLEDGPYEYDKWCEWALDQYLNAPTILPADKEGEV